MRLSPLVCRQTGLPEMSPSASKADEIARNENGSFVPEGDAGRIEPLLPIGAHDDQSVVSVPNVPHDF
jgi:hypothetical protein